MRCGLEEVAFLKLRLTHQQPSIFEEGVKLLALQVSLHFRRAGLVGIQDGLTLDRMSSNRFFALLNGDVKLPAPGTSRGFIAHEKYGQEFGIIVFVRIFL